MQNVVLLAIRELEHEGLSADSIPKEVAEALKGAAHNQKEKRVTSRLATYTSDNFPNYWSMFCNRFL